MEGVGSEVSQKIRAAIKAKLLELGAYVDDELPDYIMVMVANKRSRSQMEADLSLFLNNNTKLFTHWLHSVLKKLQEVTIAATEVTPPVPEKKPTKRTRSQDSPSKESKTSIEKIKDKKKHSKKHKEKKVKKKHKNKAEDKAKSGAKRSGTNIEDELPKKKAKKGKKLDVKRMVGRAILGDVKVRQEERHPRPNEEGVLIPRKTQVESDPDTDKEWEPAEMPPQPPPPPPKEMEEEKEEVVEAAPEPVKEAEAEEEDEVVVEMVETKAPETAVLVPTRELLREHDKLTSQAAAEAEPEKAKTPDRDPVEKAGSDLSMSPEEIRRELLLSRAKKKLEQRNLERRMRSTSPEIVILEERVHKESASSPKNEVEAPKEKRPSPPPQARRSAASPSPSSSGRLSLSQSFKSSRSSSDDGHRKISVERNISSFIVAPPDPEPPEIASVVKVKPREFLPKSKQANKNLILRAVAAAEKSVATVPVRTQKSSRKPRALYTKDLREKRLETLAVTLTNDISKGNASEHDDDPDIAESDKSEDRLRRELIRGTEEFISSKGASKETNSTFIRCWLEEVERAGENEDLIKPDEIDNLEEPLEVPNETESKDRNGSTSNVPTISQILVTVDGMRTKRKERERSKTDEVSSSTQTKTDVNRMSNRFARISKPAEDHEYKEKYREFERQRREKKRSAEGESKNLQLIAKLSKKFGQLDREFEEDTKSVDKHAAVEKGHSDRKPVRGPDDSKLRKSKEDCRYWPNCNRGNACDYYHPSSSICRSLPNCELKDQCKYKHPLCKKDLNCTSKDCAYEHSSRRRRKRSDSRDRDYSRQEKRSKPLDAEHPPVRPCRYGTRCRTRDCHFSHRNLTSTSTR